MRKISRELENPIDNILIDIAELLSPIAYFLRLTPNILTTISIFFTIICIYYLNIHNFHNASYMYMISYYFDCMDGFYARKYKMYSKFGDLYDHIADLFKFISILYTLCKIDYIKFILYIPSLISLILFFNIHLGYQELYYGKNESLFLSFSKKLCYIKNINDKEKLSNILKYTRWFGCGTFNLIFCLIIYYY